MENTNPLIIVLSAVLRSRSINQSINAPAISGAVLYNLKNLLKLANAHAERNCNAKATAALSRSASSSSLIIVVRSVSKAKRNFFVNFEHSVWSSRDDELTKGIFSEDVVQDTIGNEFLSIFSSHIGVQHYQLGLTLIELFVVALFHSDSRMCFVNFNRK